MLKIKSAIISSVSFILAILLVLFSCLIVAPKIDAARTIIFPVIGPASFVNDYYTPRPDGIHAATDVMAAKGQQLVAAVDGVITYVAYPQPSWGYDVEITDSEGYTYIYLHINDDTPGTNDGMGGPMNAYAPDMKVGNRVVKGQHIGWVGDSGRANGVAHLHFEIIAPDNNPINPYESLVQATRLPWPNIAPQMPNELLPYGTIFKGGINIEMGNFDADPQSEIVSGAGRGGSPHVRMFDTNNTPIGAGFYAYNSKFTGGVDVATGDVDGDGIDEIITGAGPGASPHVRVLKLNGSEVGGFYAYASNFSGGVRVAAGDIDGDGKDEIITAPASNGSPHIRVLKPNGVPISGFYAYSTSFTGGVDVTAADVSGDDTVEVITAPGPGGGPHIKIFSGNDGSLDHDFAAYGSFTGGVKLSAGNVYTPTAKSEILVAPWTTGGPHIRMFDGEGEVISEKMFMEIWWGGFHEIAAGEGTSRAATGINRRASIRSGIN